MNGEKGRGPLVSPLAQLVIMGRLHLHSPKQKEYQIRVGNNLKQSKANSSPVSVSPSKLGGFASVVVFDSCGGGGVAAAVREAVETRDQLPWGSRRAARPAAAWRRRWCRTPRAPSPPSVSAATMAPSVSSPLHPLHPPTQTPRFASPQYALSLSLPYFTISWNSFSY